MQKYTTAQSIEQALSSEQSGRPISQLDVERLRNIVNAGLQYLESLEAQSEMVIMPTSSDRAEAMDTDDNDNDKCVNGMDSWRLEAPKVNGQFQRLPMKLILEIERHLPAPNVVALSHTCSRFYHSSPVVIEDYFHPFRISSRAHLFRPL
ncbi:MAG: hypothetical protein Q9183_004216 [Haloplaca sp. 2 TL-2023]